MCLSRLLDRERIPDAIQLLQEMKEISEVTSDEDSKDGTLLQVEFSGDDAALHRVLAELITKDLPVISFAPRSSGGRLEDVFMSITSIPEESSTS